MSHSDTIRQALILGALLHDIGKFVQRAQKDPKAKNHSQWGEDWFKDNLAEKLTLVFSEDEKQIIRSAISNHHYAEPYISLADAISAGMDRIELEEEEGDPFAQRLISIFSRVSISSRPKTEMYHKLSLFGQDGLEETFPIPEKTCLANEYRSLLDKFNQELENFGFRGSSPQQVIEQIYFLLYKYTWCIPSAAYKDEPDISLFDHLRTTAAITTCLYDHAQESNEINITSPSFLFIGGDVSGIQSYIFDVLSQQGKVAKRLRARSLFIQLISEIAGHKILHQFRLHLCNLVISAGGNFYVVLPNLEGAKKKIIELQKEFDDWTLSQLNAEISISLASMELSGRDLADFSKVLERLKIALNYKKYQPHRLIFSANGRWSEQEFLRREVIEGDEKSCQGCHHYPLEENEEKFCRHCWDDTQIGTILPKAKYVAFFDNNKHRFQVLNYSFELWNEEDLRSKSSKEPYLILRLNNSEIRFPVVGFKYITTHIPVGLDIPQASVEEDQPVAFDIIANVSQGDKLVGYIKADVDRLGEILRFGFDPEKPENKYKVKGIKPSVSRFAGFSRMLETFFAGYIQVTLERDFKEIYTVFSGGDDLFVVGPWNKTIDFVRTIRKEFSRFSGGNADLTFSSGIILSKPHEPISFCAEDVENKLKNSKQEEGKNKMTLFEQPVTWDELDKILAEANTVIEWLEKETISRAFAYNLRMYGEMSQEYERTRKIEYLKFIPLLTYDINRNLTKEEQKEVFEWAKELMPSKENPKGGKNLPYLRIIMEYVLTYTRS